MFHPRRLRTRSPSSVETMERKPSHLSSNDQPLSTGALSPSVGCLSPYGSK
jgi:hypothetical protein